MDYFEIKGEKEFLYFGQAISCPSHLSWKIIRGADKEFGKKDVYHSAIYNDEILEIQMSATKKKKKLTIMVYSYDRIISSHQKLHV